MNNKDKIYEYEDEIFESLTKEKIIKYGTSLSSTKKVKSISIYGLVFNIKLKDQTKLDDIIFTIYDANMDEKYSITAKYHFNKSNKDRNQIRYEKIYNIVQYINEIFEDNKISNNINILEDILDNYIRR